MSNTAQTPLGLGQWMPIETAPCHVDGRRATPVLVYGGQNFPEVEQRSANGDYWRFLAKERPEAGPTHWMPLPEPPK